MSYTQSWFIQELKELAIIMHSFDLLKMGTGTNLMMDLLRLLPRILLKEHSVARILEDPLHIY